MDRPADATRGFLPRNVTSPQGEGFTSYTVHALPTVNTGTSITAQASIVFDGNPPIATNIDTVVVDSGAPTAAPSVAASSNNPVTVSLGGIDDAGGSGVALMDVWASKDGAAYTLVGDAVTGSTFAFTGVVGSSYRFLAAPTDRVGNDGAFSSASSTVSITQTTPPPPPPPPPGPPGTSFVSLVPGRLLETRTDATPTLDGQASGIGLRPAGSITELQITGRYNIPTNATAAILNVTVTDTRGDGYVTVWPCGTPQPTASNLNYTAGNTIPNLVIAKLGDTGSVCLFTTNQTHLIADINGYYTVTSGSGSTSFVSLVPGRLLETRTDATPTLDGQASGIGLRPAGSITELQITGRYNIPTNATAAILNVTVTDTRGDGYVTVWPCGTPQPTASNLNYTAGNTIPNLVIAKLGDTGSVCLFTTNQTHLIADINGYYTVTSGSGSTSFVSLVPGRLLETRTDATPTLDGQASGIGLRPAGSITELQITGRYNIPTNATAAILNVTVTDTRGDGYVTVWPCGTPQPTASNLNYTAGNTIPNLVIAKLGDTGSVCLFTTNQTHLIADINGYYTPGAA